MVEIVFEKLVPQLPEEGPPLPSGLEIKWPWAGGSTESGNPVRIAYKEINSTLDRLVEEKRREWLAKYPERPGLVEKALLWAREWANGMVSSPLYMGIPGEIKEGLSVTLYKIALDRAERYIEAFLH